MNKFGLFIVAFGCLVSLSFAGVLRDPRDGQSYKTVRIGQQEWMAENLNYATDDPELSMCNERRGQNCKKYGRLYEKYVAQEVCPPGWKLPSKEDFEELFAYVEEQSGSSDLSRLLRSREWDQGLDMFGFSLLPGGYHHPWVESLSEGDFYYERMHKNHKVGVDVFLWTSSFGPGYEDYDWMEKTIYYVSEGSSNALPLGFHRTHAQSHGYDDCGYDGGFFFSVRCINERKETRSAFLDICADENVTASIINQEIASGADVNDVDPQSGYTALHYVARFAKRPDAVMALVKRGAFVNAMTATGVTPFYIAAEYNPNPAVLKALVAAGSEIDVVDEEQHGWNALEVAVAANNADVVKVLLDIGLDKKFDEEQKINLIMNSIINSKDENVLKLLFKRGYKAKYSGYVAMQPLHLALKMQKDISFIKIILSAGATVDETAMEYAKNMPLGAYRNNVIDMLLKAKKKK